MQTPPPRWLRAALTITVGALGALDARMVSRGSDPAWIAGDFTYFWRAARVLLDGQSPYAVIRPVGHFPFQEYFLYPLPAAIAVLPLAPLRPAQGLIAFGAIGAGLLAWTATRDGLHRLPLFLSLAFLWCIGDGQWAVILTAVALSPALGWLAPVKPTLGLAALSYRLSWRAFALAAAMLALALAIRPHWVQEWLASTAARRAANYHVPILTTAAGPLLALAALRWRRPGARLLLVMACVPQSMLYYDQLPLWVVPATIGESIVLTAGCWGALFTYRHLASPALLAASGEAWVPQITALLAPILVLLVYLPCLAMVLRRPNEGPAPAWLERRLVRWRVPRWIAGRPAPAEA